MTVARKMRLMISQRRPGSFIRRLKA